VLSLLVGVNVYVFFFSPGSLKQVSQAAQAASTLSPGDPALITAQPEAAPVQGPLPAPAPLVPHAKPKRHDGTLKEHEGLGAALRREGLASPDADGVLRALSPIMNFKKELRAGLGYSVRLDGNGRLEGFELRVGPGVVYHVTRGPDAKLTVDKTAPPQKKPVR